MRKYLTTTLLLFTLPTAALAVDSEINLKEGAWNVTLQPEPATPAALPVVQMLCVTRKDPVPQPTSTNVCRLLTQDIQGDTVFWVTECRDTTTVVRSVGNATYSGTRVEGGIQATITTDGKPPELKTFKLTGRRQGA